jgi:hypothetical protein
VLYEPVGGCLLLMRWLVWLEVRSLHMWSVGEKVKEGFEQANNGINSLLRANQRLYCISAMWGKVAPSCERIRS